MLRGLIVALLAIAIAACSFNVPGPSVFRCDTDNACPADQDCVHGYCVPAEAPPGVPGASHCAATPSAGDQHTCAIRNDATAWCWGRNTAGQLGDGTTDDHPLPTQVVQLTGVTAIAAGGRHTCAIHDGVVSCWGINDSGQLGVSPTITTSPVPAAVVGLTGAVQLVVGSSHSCARLGDGHVACWGANGNGQLGDMTTIPHSEPLPVFSATGMLAGITDVAASGDSTCAIDAGHTLWCWGSGAGEPLATSVASDAVGLAVGINFVCWLTGAGAVSCLGANDVG